MGCPMVKNLLKAGFPVVAYNRDASRPAVEEVRQAGASIADSPAQVAEQSDVALICVTDSADVEQVMTADNGVLAGAKPGLIVVDHSSIMPTMTKKLAEQAAKQDVTMLDAPISGGEVGAISGALTIMVGGDQAAFDTCGDIFSAMGKTITRVGDVGAGQTTKLVNQIMGAVTMAAVAEGLVLGAKCGLDIEAMVSALLGGVARCWNLENKSPTVLDRNFKPGFMAKLLQKDLMNVKKTAEQVGVPLPFTETVSGLLSELQNTDRGDLDYSAMIQVLEERAGTEVTK
jgi:3-hydroxyisobutyrate dehydrogenase-like beta-hydroxyacid dehydrogenase